MADDDGMPVVTVYPKCSTCGAAYVLRMCFTFGKTITHAWLWQKDCKHKSPAEIVEVG